MQLEIGQVVFSFEPINVASAKLNSGKVEQINGDQVCVRYIPRHSSEETTDWMDRRWLHDKEPRDPNRGWTEEERAGE
jgi:hypothetical protein